MKTKDPVQLWKTALAQIEIKLDKPAQFKTFFADSRLKELNGKNAIIAVPNPFASDWIKMKHYDLVAETISYVYGDTLVPQFVVAGESESAIEEVQEQKSEISPLLNSTGGVMNTVIDKIEESGINTRYSMSSYIVGNSNRIAHAAAIAVMDKLGDVYNPLFIHGKTGVGKTHLAQAVGRGILERDLGKKVVYCSSENFLNDMVKAIKIGKQIQFREKYRSVNLLIIDDMQLISKWMATQDEFFNTFNDLYNNGSQIVMIADRHPSNIKNLESRLRSRMQGGMVVDIAAPDYEMRLAVLNRKAEEGNIELPSNQVEYIARAVSDNVRELEGALQKISLFNQMKPAGDLTLEEVSNLLGKDAKSRREQIKVPRILRITAKSFDVKVKDLKGPRRTKAVALARQVAMYILREEFNYKLEEVAKLLNRKDHTTVIHALDKIKSKMMIQDAFNLQVGEIITEINESAVQEDSI